MCNIRHKRNKPARSHTPATEAALAWRGVEWTDARVEGGLWLWVPAGPGGRPGKLKHCSNSGGHLPSSRRAGLLTGMEPPDPSPPPLTPLNQNRKQSLNYCYYY